MGQTGYPAFGASFEKTNQVLGDIDHPTWQPMNPMDAGSRR
jgi:hypothetical protein